jgi:hypothetical protein
MSTIDSRDEQMFPKLTPREIDRLRRFGEVRRYAAGNALFVTGDIAPGMYVLIEGSVRVTRRDPLGHSAAQSISWDSFATHSAHEIGCISCADPLQDVRPVEVALTADEQEIAGQSLTTANLDRIRKAYVVAAAGAAQLQCRPFDICRSGEWSFAMSRNLVGIALGAAVAIGAFKARPSISKRGPAVRDRFPARSGAAVLRLCHLRRHR